MTKGIAFFTGWLVGILFTCCIPRIIRIAPAQASIYNSKGPPKSQRKTLIDNDRVQVIDYQLMPGDKAPGVHTHSYPHVDVILAGGSIVVNQADGNRAYLTAHTDSVYYRTAPVTHEPINTGNHPIHMIEVHIK